MKTKPLNLIPVTCLIVAFLPGCNRIGEKNELAVDIVPTTHQSQGAQRTLFYGDTFYVVLTNQTRKPVCIYEEFSSWGYYSLSFEAVDLNGKTWKLEKTPQIIWTRNFPATFSIPPNGHYVFAVLWDEAHWPALKELNEHAPTSKMQFKAIFQEPAPQNTTPVSDVWVGRVDSTPESMTLFR